jgi:acylphosphatase
MSRATLVGRLVSDDTLACRLSVHGLVQGVFFRDGVRREAEQRGVAGWAANRPDGTVEVVLEGPAAGVRELVSYCSHGPRRAEVTHVEATERRPEGLSGFRVR